jgi:molybdopterin-binding protein
MLVTCSSGLHRVGARRLRKGQTTSHVRIDIGNGVIVTASITNEAVDDLAIAKGDAVIAVIKASDVMVAK